MNKLAFEKFCEDNPDLERSLKEIMDRHLMEINDEKSRKTIEMEINDFVRSIGGDITKYKFIVSTDDDNPRSITARPMIINEVYYVGVDLCTD